MDNALYYLTLNRQTGLATELDIVANNIANMDTTGFRREGLAFTEHVLAADGQSIAMADASARFASERPGEMQLTGGRLDIAIEGPGYFLLETSEGQVLTRAGSFLRSPEGLLVAAHGERVLDTGGAPVFLPGNAGPLEIGADGTIAGRDGPIARLAVVDALPGAMRRIGDTAWRVEDGDITPVETPRLRQGALERSNVNPVAEIARLIEVTRAYETAQSLIESEDERIRATIRTLGQPV